MTRLAVLAIVGVILAFALPVPVPAGDPRGPAIAIAPTTETSP